MLRDKKVRPRCQHANDSNGAALLNDGNSSADSKYHCSGNEDDGGVISDDFNTNREVLGIDSKIVSFLVKQLLFSRIFLLTFQCFINRLMKDYPTDAFRGIPQKSLGRSDDVIQFFFGGLSCWDARYFLHIAEFGYTWESCLAFFPLFPTVLRVIGTFFHTILYPISFYSAMILGGVILNNTIFVINGLLLYRLVLLLGGNLKEALICVYIFCWNPASIFFSTVYTESAYMLFTLIGLLVLHLAPNRLSHQVLASFVFSFALLTRANGITNFGFIGFYVMVEVILKKSPDDGKLVFEDSKLRLITKALSKLPNLIVCFCIIILPLRLFGFVMEEKFCTTRTIYKANQRVDDFLENYKSVTLPGDLENLTWCSDERGLAIIMPSYYSHVQDKYWNVGLFGYWQWRKIPFFVLAAPTLFFVFYGIFDLISTMMNSVKRIEEHLVDLRLLIPFAVQSLFLALAGIFVYNVEVSQRMLFSASPFAYVVLARIISAQTPRVVVPDDLMEPFLLPFLSIYARVRLLHFLMLSYLLGYFFIGTMLHVNWLPFV